MTLIRIVRLPRLKGKGCHNQKKPKPRSAFKLKITISLWKKSTPTTVHLLNKTLRIFEQKLNTCNVMLKAHTKGRLRSGVWKAAADEVSTAIRIINVILNSIFLS